MPTDSQIHDYLIKTDKAIQVKGPIGVGELSKLIAKFGADRVRVV